MTRKRAGKIKHFKVEEKKTKVFAKGKANKKLYTFFILFGICFLVLFLNSYFNYTSGNAYNPNGKTLAEKYYLSGPDPYYNMRLCEVTLEEGYYPFTNPHEEGGDDPLLNYPVGLRGSRPPLFNMVAVASASVLQNFMSQTDALGYSMLFLPAIYGALLILPIYGIATTLFNRKVGLIAALLVAIIPIHIGGSHGSTLSLFDHDSFLLLLFTCVFYFVIKSLKEENIKKTFLYSSLAGVFVGAVYLTWTAAQFIFTVLLLSFIVILVFNILKSKVNLKLPLTFVTLFGVSLLISLPWIVVHQDDLFGFPTMCLFASVVLFIVYYIINRLKMPWLVSLPALGVLGGAGFSFLYLVHLRVIEGWGAIQQLSITVFGEGIYGSKVSLTVAEAHNFGISQSVLSFGPALYWIGLVGFVLFVIKTYKDKFQEASLFIIIIFVVNFWLTTTAGRFLNDLVPTIVIFSAFCLFLVIDKIDYQKMIKGMRNFSGLEKRRAVGLLHVFGILFIAFLVVLPNSFLALDAAVPAEMKQQVFGENYYGAFGNSNAKTIYWVDAFSWLNTQDTEFVDEDKPAFISWWDYGFYEAAVGHHPTVADNYQVGLYAAGNFKLSKSEQEAVSVLIVRCLEGVTAHNDGKLTDEVVDVFYKYMIPYYEYQLNESDPTKYQSYNLPENQTAYNVSMVLTADLLIKYIENPTECPSYDTLIAPEYGNTILRKRADNALYHDCWELMKGLSDEGITNFYKDIQDATGYSIRYYGTEQYDTQIFGVFTFLTDRGTQGFSTGEDDYFMELYEDTNTGYKYERWQLEEWTQEDYEGKNIVLATDRKEAFYNNIWYKTYYGYGQFPNNRLPTYGLRHFKLVYYNPIVVISKYYEGATINGTVTLQGMALPGVIVYVFDEYSVPHDFAISDEQGQISLIAPAGNLSFRAFIGDALNDLNVEQFLNITENEGRQVDECNKTLSFNINYTSATVNFDTNLTNLNLNIKGQTYQNSYDYVINQSTMLNLSYLVPDVYRFTVTNSTGAVFYNTTTYLKPGDNKYNVKI